jgi:hypothetical protein
MMAWLATSIHLPAISAKESTQGMVPIISAALDAALERTTSNHDSCQFHPPYSAPDPPRGPHASL